MPRKKKTDAKPESKLQTAPSIINDAAQVSSPAPAKASVAKKSTKLPQRQDFLALDEALAHWLEQYHKTPSDEEGLRHVLVPLLVEVGRLDEANAIIKQFPDDRSAHMMYSRALLTFKKFGACPISDTALENAVRQNPSVLDYICGADMPAVEKDLFEPGSKEEAVIYLEIGMDGWLNSDGAVIWLVNYLMDELSKFNHSIDFAAPKSTNVGVAQASNAVLDFSP